MDSNDNNKTYSEEQIQFLQKLVKEQRDIDQQIKILKKAYQEREKRKKQLDNTIIKYFKTNDISHINVKDTNCRIECVTVKTKTGLSQKYVTTMLEELLKDEELARDVLDYILSGRQVTQKFKLKTIENYNRKKPRKTKAVKEDVQYTPEEKSKLVLKLKDRFNGKTKSPPSIELENNVIDEQELTENVLKKHDNIEIKENKNNNIEIKENKNNNVENKNEISLKSSKTTKVPKLKLKKDISTIIKESTTNEILKPSTENITINTQKPSVITKIPNNQNINTNINANIENFIGQQMSQLKDLSSGKSVTDLMSLYKDLIDRSNTINS